MAKRKKRLKRQIEGLNKAIEKHEEKLRTLKGRQDTTHDYWEGEIKRLGIKREDREGKLKRKKKP